MFTSAYDERPSIRFLAYRVWVLSHKNVYVVSVVGFSRAVNVLGAVSDLGITTALSFYLWSSKSGMRRTDAIVNRLILFCVRTGSLTTACAILSLITISVFPNTFVYITFYSTLARFYSISLLATLNARSELRNQTSGTTHSLANVSLDNNQNRSGRPVVTSDSDSGVRHIAIKQDVETFVANEYEMKAHRAL
ncbi:hypothetical protein PM082_020911 [Marasmius tenuissimus]|nr:hypothetical protein PM082_020911 [Marasmius tenuissimus]